MASLLFCLFIGLAGAILPAVAFDLLTAIFELPCGFQNNIVIDKGRMPVAQIFPKWTMPEISASTAATAVTNVVSTRGS